MVFAEFTDTIANALTALHEEASPLGLQINWSKTKIQPLSDFIPPPQRFCPIADQEIESVTSFIYLGPKITSDCHSDAELMRRIQLVRSSFGRLYPACMALPKIPSDYQTTHLQLCCASRFPLWMRNVDPLSQVRKIDAFHRKLLRNILDIRWFHHIRNEQVYARAGNPTLLSTTIKRRRLQLLGHIARLDDDVPAKKIITAACRPPRGWRRPRDRPIRLTWVHQVADDRSLSDLLRLAQERVVFRQLVATVT